MTSTVDSADAVRRATDRFVASLAGISETEWTQRLPAGGWSLAEVTEHVAIANAGVLAVLEQALQPLEQPTAVDDDEIPYLFYRGDEPPGVAGPTGTWEDRSTAIADFEASGRRIAGWADGYSADLRDRGFAHPAFGTMDGVQWILFSAAHTLRHHAQVLAIRQS